MAACACYRQHPSCKGKAKKAHFAADALCRLPHHVLQHLQGAGQRTHARRHGVHTQTWDAHAEAWGAYADMGCTCRGMGCICRHGMHMQRHGVHMQTWDAHAEAWGA